MPTTARYLTSQKNVGGIFQKIQNGVPPDKFNNDHLKAIGFTSSNDRAIVPLLKDLGFLAADGTPTQRYREYRDQARSKAVMAEALREAYPDLFVINEKISKSDRDAVVGRFKTLHDSSDPVADAQARTFFSLLDLADLKAEKRGVDLGPPSQAEVEPPRVHKEEHSSHPTQSLAMPLTYRFEIQLPPTKDVEVFRAIFRAMKEKLFNA